MKNQSRFVRVFRSCMLAALSTCLINGTSQAASQKTQEADGLNYAPRFAPELVHRLKPALCTKKAVSGYVMTINEPLTARCGKFVITVTGISTASRPGEDEDATHVEVSLNGRQQKLSKVVLPMEDFPAEFVDSAQFADLNGDGKDDFILNLSNHGVGLAAEFTGTVYLLSSAVGYRYLTLSGMNNVPRYLRFGNNPQAVLVLQRMGEANDDSEGIPTLDNKPHLFFVFDLLQFDATAPKGAKLNNSLDARFPFWTLFTYSPSHAETTLLSPATKKSLWRDPLAHEVSGGMVER